MKTLVFIVLVAILGVFLFFHFAKFKSAFEADKRCHQDINNEKNNINSLKCDHDFETRQWILYSLDDKSSEYQIYKRYYY